MLALWPDLVDLTVAQNDGPAQFRPYDRFPKPTEDVPASASFR